MMKKLQKALISQAGLVGALLMTTTVLAQDAAQGSVEDRLRAVEDAAKAAQMSGDNAWMLVSSAIVLLMTGPGLALFYGGLVRKKNVLTTMMQSFAMMALMTVLWALYGYSLSFAEGNAFIGGLSHVFLKGVGAEPSGYAATIPHQTFMIFQLMFAIITPALITGAFAERMKFSAMLVFMTLWATIVYFPLAHMVWGSGGFLGAGSGTIKALDFAGGTVVHISSGFSALVCALYLGKRIGYPKMPMRPHSMVLSFIGACLLWVGWFGFNAGSALSAGSLATSAFVATHFGAAAAAVGWLLAEWIHSGKPTVLGGISGAVAGLVGITPAAGFVTPMSGLMIGFITGIVCFFMVIVVKTKSGYDDSLDAFGVHGAGGFTGAILTGVFAQQAVNPIFGADQPVGLLDGNGGQLLNQFLAALLTIGLAMVATFVILKVVDLMMGVRVTGEDEIQGLDLTLHGEEGYNMDVDLVASGGFGANPGNTSAAFVGAPRTVE